MDNIKQRVQLVVNDIYRDYGEVRPSLLVQAARPKNSPAHEGFEWDNEKAGEEYRLMQARTWIRRVEIVIEEKAEHFVHVPVIQQHNNDFSSDDREGYYKPVSVISKNEGERQAAMRATLETLNSARRAYEELKKAAEKAKKPSRVNFKKADKGFDMVEAALDETNTKAVATV